MGVGCVAEWEWMGGCSAFDTSFLSSWAGTVFGEEVLHRQQVSAEELGELHLVGQQASFLNVAENIENSVQLSCTDINDSFRCCSELLRPKSKRDEHLADIPNARHYTMDMVNRCSASSLCHCYAVGQGSKSCRITSCVAPVLQLRCG